jgi:hypothetical protein
MPRESKLRENLRYIGYTIGVVAVGAVVLVLYIVLAAFLDIVFLVILLATAGFLVVLAVASIFYLFIEKGGKEKI